MTVDLNLPTFGLDCQDWLVATEADGLLVEDDDAPVVAVLSTAIISGDDLHCAQAVLSLALLDDDEAVDENGLAVARDEQWSEQDICVIDAEWDAGYARFAVPAPGGELAIVAEFSSAPGPTQEMIDRFYDLVTSLRWAA